MRYLSVSLNWCEICDAYVTRLKTREHLTQTGQYSGELTANGI